MKTPTLRQEITTLQCLSVRKVAQPGAMGTLSMTEVADGKRIGRRRQLPFLEKATHTIESSSQTMDTIHSHLSNRIAFAPPILPLRVVVYKLCETEAFPRVPCPTGWRIHPQMPRSGNNTDIASIADEKHGCGNRPCRPRKSAMRNREEQGVLSTLAMGITCLGDILKDFFQYVSQITPFLTATRAHI
jgi:hypothetical protein